MAYLHPTEASPAEPAKTTSTSVLTFREQASAESLDSVVRDIPKFRMLGCGSQTSPPPSAHAEAARGFFQAMAGVLQETTGGKEQACSSDTPELATQPVCSTSHSDYWEARRNALIRIHRAVRVKEYTPFIRRTVNSYQTVGGLQKDSGQR